MSTPAQKPRPAPVITIPTTASLRSAVVRAWRSSWRVVSVRAFSFSGPLRGVRVLAFELAFSLPSGTRTLAELGAEVVRVVRPARGGPRGHYITVVDGTALSKPSIVIDLTKDEGRALARRLAVQADAVC